MHGAIACIIVSIETNIYYSDWDNWDGTKFAMHSFQTMAARVKNKIYESKGYGDKADFHGDSGTGRLEYSTGKSILAG